MKQHLNQTLLGLAPSGIRKFAQLASQVEGCMSLTIGEPDFSTPEAIKEAAKAALDQNLTHYPPNAGYPRFGSASASLSGRKTAFLTALKR